MIALLEAKRAGLFKRDGIWKNVIAGVVVGIVALPLAMAFAIASGAKPEQGLYTAIVAGLATSFLGGTRVQISGPTGAFVAVLAGITAQYGIDGLQVATLMAGLMFLRPASGRIGNPLPREDVGADPGVKGRSFSVPRKNSRARSSACNFNGVQAQLRATLERAEILRLVGEENICANLIEVSQRIGGTVREGARAPV